MITNEARRTSHYVVANPQCLSFINKRNNSLYARDLAKKTKRTDVVMYVYVLTFAYAHT